MKLLPRGRRSRWKVCSELARRRWYLEHRRKESQPGLKALINEVIPAPSQREAVLGLESCSSINYSKNRTETVPGWTGAEQGLRRRRLLQFRFPYGKKDEPYLCVFDSYLPAGITHPGCN